MNLGSKRSLTRRRLESAIGPRPKLGRELLARRVRLSGKRLSQYLRYSSSIEKQILLIAGCQRSGTTLLTRIFERDSTTRVYAEVSKLSSRDAPKYLRLNPLDEVEREISKARAELIVVKPLVESQNTSDILDYFGGRAIWMYRGYPAVTSSIIRKWGPEHSAKDLVSIVNDNTDWRSEKVSESLRDVVSEFYAPDMDPRVAGALFWYVRNSFAFDQNLDADPRVLFCRYEDLIAAPAKEMKLVYDALGRRFPGSSLVSDVEARRHPEQDATLGLPSRLQALCDELLDALDAQRLR